MNITILDVEQIAFVLAQKLLKFDEPIPDYSTRFPNVLESCVAAPFQWFSGHPLYRGLVAKASMLFYLMVKNHPFQNGNKRIAITTLLVFLSMNGKWLRVRIKNFYDFSNSVSASKPKDKDQMIKKIKKFIRNHIVDATFST
jgi:prophage maintenance system killer protein